MSLQFFALEVLRHLEEEKSSSKPPTSRWCKQFRDFPCVAK